MNKQKHPSKQLALRNNTSLYVISNTPVSEQLKTSDLIINPYIEAATSNNTRLAYQLDLRHFMHWGSLLPTSADVIIQYLHDHAESLNTRTLERRLTAIRNWHRYQGFPDPTATPLVQKTLTGIKNIHGTPKNKAPAMQLSQLKKIVSKLRRSGYLIDWRNIALLQIGFFGAFRRSELVSIEYKHIAFVPEGVEILVPRSKTDQTGKGQVCAIPHGDSTLCPVSALKTWLELSNITSGPIFRGITKADNLTEKAITGNHLNQIIKSLAIACKLPNANNFSSHSLRRGFATEASKRGASFSAIMKQGRWKHEGTVLGYIEEGTRFEANAAGVLLE